MLKWIFTVAAVLPAFFIGQVLGYLVLGPGWFNLLFGAITAFGAYRLVRWLYKGVEEQQAKDKSGEDKKSGA